MIHWQWPRWKYLRVGDAWRTKTSNVLPCTFSSVPNTDVQHDAICTRTLVRALQEEIAKLHRRPKRLSGLVREHQTYRCRCRRYVSGRQKPRSDCPECRTYDPLRGYASLIILALKREQIQGVVPTGFFLLAGMPIECCPAAAVDGPCCIEMMRLVLPSMLIFVLRLPVVLNCIFVGVQQARVTRFDKIDDFIHDRFEQWLVV